MILKPEKDERFIDGIALYNSFGYPRSGIESTALDEELPSDDAVAQTPAGSLSPVEEFNRAYEKAFGLSGGINNRGNDDSLPPTEAFNRAYERFLKMCRRK